MMALSRILRDYDTSGALHSVVNLYGFLDDHVFLTKSGDLGVVLAFEGVDDECLDPDQHEGVTRRFEVALRGLDESIRLSQYLLKRNRVPIACSPVTDPVVNALLARRQRFLEDKSADLYAISLYAVLLTEARSSLMEWSCLLPPGQPDSDDRVTRTRGDSARPSLSTLRRAFSTSRTLSILDEAIAERRRQLAHKAEAFSAQLADPLHPRVLRKDQAFQFFRRLLNYDPMKADAVRLQRDTWLDYAAGDSVLECHRGHLRLDDAYVRVLTLKEFPAQTFPQMFRAVAAIPSNLILMSDWHREPQDRIRALIHAMRRHWHQSRVSLTSYLGDTPATPGEFLVDDSATALVRDLGACLTELTVNGRYVGAFTLTAVLYDLDPAGLDRSVAACAKAFAAQDAQVTDERINLLNAWLAVLPGNAPYNLRARYLLNTNAADLALVFAPDAGSPINVHLGREALAVLETSEGTPYHLNLHVDDVAHTLVLGATGSGKSFFLNFLIAHLQRYSPRTLIFDLGGSYTALTQYFGGTALRLGLEHRPVTINPFCLEPTPANLHFLCGFVKVLIQSGGQYTLSIADDRDLYEQIQAVYEVDPEQRRLFSLVSILRPALAQPLQRWVEGGPYAALFDHAHDTLTLAPFQAIDFEGLDAYPQLLEPLLFYLLHRADAALADPGQAGALTVFVLDEAWRFLQDPTIRQYVTEALKTWRKKNACVILATQSSEDLARSALLRVAIESCPTKCFLANPHVDRALYQELFHLNETEADGITRLIPRQQILLKRPDRAKVLNLIVDPESARLFSAAPRATPDPPSEPGAVEAISNLSPPGPAVTGAAGQRDPLAASSHGRSAANEQLHDVALVVGSTTGTARRSEAPASLAGRDSTDQQVRAAWPVL